MRWFTSDLHFGHRGVINFCNRPWGSVEQMDAGLIKNWNDFVEEDDEIFILGDLFFCGKTRAKEILSQLKGKKSLIIGNHDWDKIPRHRAQEFGFERMVDCHYVEIAGQQVMMSHFPYHGDHTTSDRFVEYRLADKGLWLLHGHVHNCWKRRDKMINVGVDVWNWHPISETLIENVITGKVKLEGEEKAIPGSY